MDSELTSEQYESILKYMEATSEENFQTATQVLRNHAFNINAAVNARFGGGGNVQQNHHEEYQQQNHNEEETVYEYIKFLREKQQNSSLFFGVYSFVKGFLVGIVKGVSQFILPTALKNKLLRSPFYQMYNENLNVNFNEESFDTLLRKSYDTRKPIICAISSLNNKHEAFLQIFNHPRISKKINESFLFLGALENEDKINRITEDKIPPTVIVFRRNVYQKIEIIQKYIGEEQVPKITVEQLNRLLQRNQNMWKRDRNIQIRYRNHIRRIQYGGYAGFYEQQQEELYPERARVASEMIKQQNEDYKRIAEENVRKMKEKENMMREEEQLLEERKVRKLSIPDEPMDGEIVRINFRCPDGSTKIRNFLIDEKLELVYNWVETNEEIEFEDSNKRAFELLYSFPPASLESKKNEYLKDIFDSDQEKIMIREL